MNLIFSENLVLQHFQTDDAKPEVVKNFAAGIKKTFQEIATFALPGPGSKVVDGSDGESLRLESELSCIYSK